RKVTIGHTYELDPPAEEMRAKIAAGELGEGGHVDSWFGYNLDGPFGKAILGSPDHLVHRLPGKLFHNNINHVFNKITEFVTDERPDVHARAWRGSPKIFGDIRDELLDELRVVIVGSKVSAFATFTSSVRPVLHFERVYGTRNTLHLDFQSRTVTLEQG